MTTQRWVFPDPDKCAVVKDYLPYRHPSNRTKWIDKNTVELIEAGPVVDKYLKGLGGVRVDKLPEVN